MIDDIRRKIIIYNSIYIRHSIHNEQYIEAQSFKDETKQWNEVLTMGDLGDAILVTIEQINICVLAVLLA